MACEFYHDPFFLPYFFEEKLDYPPRLSPYISEEDLIKINDFCSYEDNPHHSHNGILELLPSNPFDMDFSPAIHDLSDWLEGLEMGYLSAADDDIDCVMDLITSCSHASRDPAFEGPIAEVVSNTSVDCAESLDETSTEENGETHLALSLALAHLGARDLLAVEQVCKSLNLTVRGDPLFWRTIQIKEPLNEKLTDEALIQIASKAQGHLQCLSLVDCQKITDDALKHVVETNKNITKLSVPGCSRLTIEGILYCLHKLERVKQVRIGGLYGVTSNHFETIKLIMGEGCRDPEDAHKPHYYCKGEVYLPWGDERAIDIEMCPKCERLRMVYDCPLEACGSLKECRACTICIPRCVICGRCVDDGQYEESFSLDFICFHCCNSHVIN